MKRNCRIISAFVFILTLGFLSVVEPWAQSAGTPSAGVISPVDEKFPSLEPQFLYEDSSVQKLSGEEMVRLGILFSLETMDQNAVDRCMAKYRSILSYVKAPEVMKLDERSRAEKVLSIMYQRLLKRYETDQTKVDVALETGTYNCVSASIIYGALAKDAGLEVKGQIAPEHCFCSVYVDGKKIDVETTNPAGFEPGTKKLSQDSRYYVVPQQRYSGRKEVSDRVLVSLVAKNLASLYNDEDNFAAAIPLSVTRREFLSSDPTGIDDSVADFETLCSNYVVVLNNQGKFDEALEWVKLVNRKYAFNDKLQQVFENAVYNSIAIRCEKNDIAGAINVFDLNQYLMREGARKNLEEILLLSRAQYETDSMSSKEAIVYLQKLRKNPGAQNFRSKTQIESWLEYYWLQVVQEKFDRELYLDGAKEALLGLNDLPASANLKKAYNLGLNNYDVTVHNQFARYANSGNLKDARKVVEEGLREHPESKVLKDDLKLIESMLQ